MTIENQLRLAAIHEVLHSSFALTQQYLAVNKLRTDNDIPFIEGVIIDKEKFEASVFFPVMDEDYYFVVYLDIGAEVTVRWVGMDAGTSVDLRVISEDRSLNELLTIINIPTTKQWEKGQPRITREASSNGVLCQDDHCIISLTNEVMLHKHSGFTICLNANKYGEVEEKLKSLLEYLMPFKDALTQLSKIATAEISVGYRGYKDEMWGINLDYDLVHALSELHLSIDIDLYASGPDLGE